MLPELRYELLFFCPRDDLERLQPVSRTLLDRVVAGSNVLPLRPVQRVNMDIDDSNEIQIFVALPVDDDDDDQPQPDYKASVREGDFTEIFLRLQHACIKEFGIGIRDSPFLRYWKAQEPPSSPCRTNDTDCGVLDSIVNHVRPRTILIYVPESWWHKNGDTNDVLELLDRDSFLHNLQTCRLTVGKDAFPPSSYFLKERGYPYYEVCCDRSNVAGGVDDFIESFVRNGCANQKLVSVWVRWIEPDDGPQSPAPKRLSKPTKVDMPLSENHMTIWLRGDVHRASHCEMHSFVNKKQWKRMGVYKWSVKNDDANNRYTTHVLQCRVENL